MVQATQIHSSDTQLAATLASINFIRNLGADHHTVESYVTNITVVDVWLLNVREKITIKNKN